jgi:peptidyl-prolyl cis-trans isomerase C
MTRSAVAALALIVVLSGCSPKRSGEVLARVGDKVITTEDFKQEVKWRLDHHRPLPEKSVLLEEMIAHELALQKATALGLQKNSDVRRNYEEMLVGELKDRELVPQVQAATVSQQEIEAAYRRDIAKYTQPAKARLAVIYMKLDRKANAEEKSSVETKMADAQKAATALTSFSKGFGAIAMDYSEDQASRYRGGDAGWFDHDAALFRLPKEVVQAGLELQQVGQVTPVIRTSKGLYLVMKTDVRDQSVTPLARVSASIERRLLAEKKQQVEQNFANNLRAATRVQTEPVALLQVDYPTTTVAQIEEKMPPALPRSQ